MKIAFNRAYEDSTLGPYVFLNRLIKYLKTQKEVEIARPGRYHDLHFITISGSGRRADQYHAKKVLRVDGIYHDLSRNTEEDNRSIRDTYHDVDAIIFQCNFARDMLYKHFGSPQKARYEAIIYNGTDATFSPEGDKIDYGFKHTIIASGKWYIHKRLPCMINSFLQLSRDDVGMVILGEVTEKVEHPRIKYLGLIKPQDLPSYYRGADLMLHFAFTDWCPNTVVEALSCGLPIITTHNGGTPELIKDNGIIIKSDPDYNMEFIDFQKLPKVNPILAANAIDILIDSRYSFIYPRPDLQMDFVGQRYLEFFKKVLGK